MVVSDGRTSARRGLVAYLLFPVSEGKRQADSCLSPPTVVLHTTDRRSYLVGVREGYSARKSQPSCCSSSHLRSLPLLISR